MNKKTYSPSKHFSKKSHFSSIEDYEQSYRKSIEDPDKFWSNVASRISWYKPWKKTSNYNFKNAEIRWFEEAELNVSYNCLDRHIENGDGERTALIWEGNDSSENKFYTYNELFTEVNKFSNVLKSLGAKKGDRVCLYTVSYTHLTLPTTMWV